ncbi:MAG TPA: hypothetical protein VGN74_00970 [Brevundimonas sp.]|jgi:hypothetical protein|uniref:hypothetical protein n=1 Tax=Brevundimonas sp. TaxID=1871086 RepID=UPI002E157CA1|nr:hypothetical protein [Brevundimonas sp.]
MTRSRLTVLVALPLCAAALAACASTGGPNRYQTELDAYEAECRARDGILQPRTGVLSGQVRADNVCVIRGGTYRPD